MVLAYVNSMDIGCQWFIFDLKVNLWQGHNWTFAELSASKPNYVVLMCRFICFDDGHKMSPWSLNIIQICHNSMMVYYAK